MTRASWGLGAGMLLVALLGPEIVFGKDSLLYTIAGSALAIGVWINGATYAIIDAIRPKPVDAAESN